jgi:hypothetical protein
MTQENHPPDFCYLQTMHWANFLLKDSALYQTGFINSIGKNDFAICMALYYN